MRYQGVPIELELRVDTETRIRFDETVEIGYADALAGQLDMLSVQGIVYLKPRHPFSTQRLAVKGKESGRFVLLDVAASFDAEVIEEVALLADEQTSRDPHVSSISPFELLRVIANWTLNSANETTLPSGVTSVSNPFGHRSVYHDIDIQTTVLGALRTKEWLALAVELRNNSRSAIDLDPNQLAGHWAAVGFLSTRLLPAHKRGATSAMFLVRTSTARHDGD